MAAFDVRFVHLPRPATGLLGRRSQFRSASIFSRALKLLEQELTKLHARDVTIQAGFDKEDIRLDGWPRSSARPKHAGVILQFRDRQNQVLTFKALKFSSYEENLYAIAMTLEALRAVDRYGVVEGEQYAGFKQLPSAATMMDSEARAFFINYAPGLSLDDAYRELAKRFHPDAETGSHEQFILLQRAYRTLKGKP
jgi:hypothetical protein